MSERISQAIKEQEELVADCKKGIESNKLKVWSFKADLAMLEEEHSSLAEEIQKNERKHYAFVKASREAFKSLKLVSEGLGKHQFSQVLAYANPSPAVQDIGAGICVYVGSFRLRFLPPNLFIAHNDE